MRDRIVIAGPAVAAVLAVLLASAVLLPAQAAEEGAPKVNINRAGSEELQSLPGIGPALAARILEYREEHGAFRRVEDLMNVRGIGEKNFLKLRDRITVDDKGSKRR